MLNELQRALEIIYGVDAPHRVEDFVVGPDALAQFGARVRAPEELFVRQEPDALELALYVSPEVLARLPGLGQGGARGFLERLLPAFSTAAEGVSHFLYVMMRALGERSVSLVELEVQAEIDKFAASALVLWKHGERRRSRELRERLYERVHFRDGLAADERARYAHANRLGRGYAQFLEARFISAGALEGLLRELRHTWRLGSSDKLEYLARWA